MFPLVGFNIETPHFALYRFENRAFHHESSPKSFGRLNGCLISVIEMPVTAEGVIYAQNTVFAFICCVLPRHFETNLKAVIMKKVICFRSALSVGSAKRWCDDRIVAVGAGDNPDGSVFAESDHSFI